MVDAGDHVICAVSGGADSVALLFAMYLLKEKLEIRLSAAHFNHRLRGEESDRDEAFVREFCGHYDIPLFVGSGEVKPGKKGLEAAARDARYAFLRQLPGKIATAHTADDNAETVLMRLIRGTGLKGLGAISPVRGNLIRPMLTVTRQDVLAFLEKERISYMTDSSNETDAFLHEGHTRTRRSGKHTLSGSGSSVHHINRGYLALCLEHNHTCRLPRLEERKGLNDFCLWSDGIAKEAICSTSYTGMGDSLIAFHKCYFLLCHC